MALPATEIRAMPAETFACIRRMPSPRVFARLACLVLLACVAHAAHAAAAFRCSNAAGHVAFQDTPCADTKRQVEITLPSQPTIGAPGERGVAANADVHSSSTSLQRAPAHRRSRHAKPATAWECRAGDGEVFYRLSRCPASIAGDGVVRGDGNYAVGKRRRGNAWGRIHVQAAKIPRNEACQRIHALTADSRDGHQHDERVSTYDQLMGRDPCSSP